MTMKRGRGVEVDRKQFRSVETPGQHVLALDPKALSLWWPGGFDENAVLDGGVALVAICGPLEHHGGWWFDSYDSIVERAAEAFSHADVRAVVLCIDSPGGDANGVEEAHRKLKALRAQYDKPLFAYANESCYSAAYWLGCSADEIVLPVTGGAGSVGVIATAVDCTELNKRVGVRVELVTTGSHKADGHPDRPLTKEILETLQARVDQIGEVFFASVGESRGMTPEAVRALQAGVFLGEDAVTAGLADGVMGWDDFIAYVRDEISGVDAPTADPVGLGGQAPVSGSSSPDKAERMTHPKITKATKAHAKAKTALKAAKTPEEITAATEAFEKSAQALFDAKMKYSKKTVEESEEDDGEDSEEEEEESEEESEEEEADEEESEEADEEESEEADSDDDDDQDDDDKDTKKSKSKAVASLSGKAGKSRLGQLYDACASLTGQRSVSGILGALSALKPRLESAKKLEGKVEKLETESRATKVDRMLAAASADGKVTPPMRASLRAQGLKDPRWLKGHLASLPKRVRTASEASTPLADKDGRPQGAPATLEYASLPPDQKKAIEQAAAASGQSVDDFMRDMNARVKPTTTPATPKH